MPLRSEPRQAGARWPGLQPGLRLILQIVLRPSLRRG